MATIPEKVSTIGLLPCFGNEAGIERQNPLALQPDHLVDQLPVEADSIKLFGKLTRVGLLRKVAVAAQITEVDLATNGEDGRIQRQQEISLRFGNIETIEYLLCQFHSAVSLVERYR